MSKWRAPNNPTGPAKQVWSALFPNEPWPKGWRVHWAGFMRGALGLTIYGRKEVLLSYADMARSQKALKPAGAKGPIEVLIHEFVHVRSGPSLRHGKEFTSLENSLHRRLF